jgi:hypothetical protein
MTSLKQLDESLYLMANRDLRSAQVNAVAHFAQFGQFENRNYSVGDFNFLDNKRYLESINWSISQDPAPKKWLKYLAYVIAPNLKVGIFGNHKFFLGLNLPNLKILSNSLNYVFPSNAEFGNCYIEESCVYDTGSASISDSDSLAYPDRLDQNLGYYFDQTNLKLYLR